MDKKFNTVVLGGTFDHLHKGHKEFISFALSNSSKVIIGLTSDEYIKKISNIKYQISNIKSYAERKTNLEKFLREEKAIDRTSIVEINDVFGITLDKDLDADAIIVVEKTLGGAEKINAKRKELGLPPLEIIIAPSVAAEDGSMISSSRIRAGEIDRKGRLYVNPLWLKQRLSLPENLREELRKPFGELTTDDNLESVNKPLIVVGDITAQKFNKLSLNPKISIVDFNVARKKKFDTVSELGFIGDKKVIKVENPAGKITPELFKAIRKAFLEKERVIIQVVGEEDLAVLPAVLSASLGSVVFYGQPGRGVVKIQITEENKERAYSLLTQFNTRGY